MKLIGGNFQGVFIYLFITFLLLTTLVNSIKNYPPVGVALRYKLNCFSLKS